ncbi:MAG: hypothetical protein Q4P23_06655 [Micrococcaceae bacterium]|nr:hypothetical protein [Micrococcaceae bacterium]
MNKKAVAALLLSGGLLLGGCGAAESEPSPTDQVPVESGTVAAQAQSREAAEAVTALDVAKQLEGEIPTITAVTEVTEDNDANNLIGRPGQYVSAAWIADKSGVAKETGIDGGAVVEVFATADDAQTRSDYIQSVLKEGGGVFGTEYHYLKDSRLLRVSGNLKPSSAKVYEEAAAR